jgi:isoamylase
VVIDDYFDWEGDRHLRRDLSETVIYEMHVRGFTRSKTSGVEHPGTYLGVIEKIPYLKSLGVTAVELMPVHEFPILDIWGRRRSGPTTGATTRWPSSRRTAATRGYEPGAQVNEFKQMVKALHQAGIEVILDVVFNHTCEGNELGPVLSFKGLENRVYYMLGQRRQRYSNYSGCGNTVNGNHPIVREMIFHCLRHWVHNYHVDGFRFDLASILSRDRHGQHGAQPAAGRGDRRRSAAGRHEDHRRGVGRGRGLPGRLVRRSALGRVERPLPRRRAPLLARRSGMLGAFATRLAGSSDLYEHAGAAVHSINFITSHDGFTLNDLVSYKRQAQRGQRRRQPRRRQQQPQRQLRRGRPDARKDRSRSCGTGRSRTCWPRCCSARACR